MNRIGNILLATTLMLGSAGAGAQGIVRFTNFGPGLNAPVTNSVTGQLVDGSGFLVQLYGGPAGSLEAVLAPLDSQASFMSGGSAGYFDGGLATNTFVLPGTTGTFQARAWSAGYATYEQAYSAGLVDPNVLVGTSSLFQNATGSASGAYLTELTGFPIAPAGEVKTILYLLVGAALLVFRVRT